MNARITIGNATILRLLMGANVNITGQNGLTPYIGSNGNWWIGITDTGFKVVGNDGLTPYIKNGNWWIGEIDTGVAADAQPWTPIFSLALDGSRYVQKLTSYVGGSGVAPTANIGQYLKSDGTFTSVISEAATYTNAEALSSKADKGGSDKTLKQVEDEIVQLAGEKLEKNAIFTLPSSKYSTKEWMFALSPTLVYYNTLCKFTKNNDFTCYLKMGVATTNIEVKFFQIINNAIFELHTQTFTGTVLKSFTKSDVSFDFNSIVGNVYIGLSASGGFGMSGVSDPNIFYYDKTTKAIVQYTRELAYWMDISIGEQYSDLVRNLKDFADKTNDELLSADGYDAAALVDDFSTVKEWEQHPSYPLPFTISGGILSFSSTENSHQGIRIPLKNMSIGLLSVVKIRIRKTSANLSVLDVGFSFGGANYTSQSDPYRTFLPSELSSVFQDFEFKITTNALANLYLVIGFEQTKNKGDSYEIDFVSVNENRVGYNTKTVEIINDLKSAVAEIGGSTGYDLQAIVESNNGGTINLKSGIYETNIPLHSYIQNGTKIIGNQNSVVKYTGTGTFFDPIGKQDITLEGFSIQGNQAILPAAMTVADVKAKTGIGTVNGIYASGICHNIRIKDLTIFNFSGIGIGGANTHQLYSKTIKISGCLVYNCYLGLFMNVRSEYHEIFGNQFCYNRINGWIDGGNNFGAVNQFNGGGVGLVLYGSGNNDTHGSMGNCSFNHNLSYGLMSIQINNGYTFTGCHIFDGKLYIENSSGFSFTGGELAGEIECVTDNGLNMIANNIFLKTYNGGTITGSPTLLSLKNNGFIDGSDSSIINNNI